MREQIKERRFRSEPVREVTIPKANGKLRRLGTAAAADRVVPVPRAEAEALWDEVAVVPAPMGPEIRPQVRARGGVIDCPASSSKTTRAPRSAAMPIPAAGRVGRRTPPGARAADPESGSGCTRC